MCSPVPMHVHVYIGLCICKCFSDVSFVPVLLWMCIYKHVCPLRVYGPLQLYACHFLRVPMCIYECADLCSSICFSVRIRVSLFLHIYVCSCPGISLFLYVRSSPFLWAWVFIAFSLYLSVWASVCAYCSSGRGLKAVNLYLCCCNLKAFSVR